ncbi:MAG: shikimate dehydrogenase [SAR202 cluster bacterium]|nr:shikimate dehydrogenase [SAR202 cluster bacterium]
MTHRVGIFGYPLGHSMSPALQQAALDEYALDALYEAWPTPPDRLAEAVAGLREPGCYGANVTVPHKEAVMGMLDRLDQQAEAIGAVNTIVTESDGKLAGYNTDIYGFLASLSSEAGFDPAGKRVVMLGAGGAAKAAAFALVEGNVASLDIANRTVARAEALIAELSSNGAETSAFAIDSTGLADRCANADLIVNCTSIGMRGSPSPDASPLLDGAIQPGCLVYDIVYNPEVTPLLAQAEEAGARTLGGLPMLVYQGAAAFEKWTGMSAPVEVMMAAARRAMEEQTR